MLYTRLKLFSELDVRSSAEHVSSLSFYSQARVECLTTVRGRFRISETGPRNLSAFSPRRSARGERAFLVSRVATAPRVRTRTFCDLYRSAHENAAREFVYTSMFFRARK